MTIDQFLEQIPKEGWFLNQDKKIRRKIDRCVQCPISSLENKHSLYASDIAYRNNFTEYMNIIHAADNYIWGEQIKDVRERLLKTLNLE